MNELKFFDQNHKLLSVEKGIPKKLSAHTVKGANAYSVKVGDEGYMLFQHIPGELWNIWISHYLFNKNTSIYCEGTINGVEFHNILEGEALYKNRDDDWQHFREGDHNVLHNPKIKSIAKFTDTAVVTFDVHLTTHSFKTMVANQPIFKEWMHYFSAGINARLFKDAPSRNISLQAIITEIVEKCKKSVFDPNGEQHLLHRFLNSMMLSKNPYCSYKFSYEEIQALLKARDTLKSGLSTKVKVTDLHKETLMGHKKFTEGFKLIFGVPPSTYVMTEKIKVCKSLMLQDNKLTNEDFASITNFNTGSHFARAFRNVEGCSPKQFRKKYEVHQKEKK